MESKLESQRRALEAATKAQAEQRDRALTAEKNAQVEAQRRAKESEARQVEAQHATRGAESRAQAEFQRRAKEAVAKTPEDTRKQPRDAERIQRGAPAPNADENRVRMEALKNAQKKKSDENPRP